MSPLLLHFWGFSPSQSLGNNHEELSQGKASCTSRHKWKNLTVWKVFWIYSVRKLPVTRLQGSLRAHLSNLTSKGQMCV